MSSDPSKVPTVREATEAIAAEMSNLNQEIAGLIQSDAEYEKNRNPKLIVIAPPSITSRYSQPGKGE